MYVFSVKVQEVDVIGQKIVSDGYPIKKEVDHTAIASHGKDAP